MKTGVTIIAEERYRQIHGEEYSFDHDYKELNGNLSNAAACYAVPNGPKRIKIVKELWPWNNSAWKPSPLLRIKELAKAGALIAAEIDRLQRIKQ